MKVNITNKESKEISTNENEKFSKKDTSEALKIIRNLGEIRNNDNGET